MLARYAGTDYIGVVKARRDGLIAARVSMRQESGKIVSSAHGKAKFLEMRVEQYTLSLR